MYDERAFAAGRDMGKLSNEYIIQKQAAEIARLRTALETEIKANDKSQNELGRELARLRAALEWATNHIREQSADKGFPEGSAARYRWEPEENVRARAALAGKEEK